jgi:hypothetical protein
MPQSFKLHHPSLSLDPSTLHEYHVACECVQIPKDDLLQNSENLYSLVVLRLPLKIRSGRLGHFYPLLFSVEVSEIGSSLDGENVPRRIKRQATKPPFTTRWLI